jgi:GMP synthase-like glutamine amidotransferase
MRVAIVENTRVTHHGQVGVALHEAGALIDVFKPWADQRLPDASDFDALAVFGGEQTAVDDGIHPYLPRLAGRMRVFHAADKPVLGICLGAQILARAFGAENRIGVAHEFGWHEVRLTGAGRADPVLGALPAAFPIFQWHADSFTLPEGADHLAENPAAAMQAFRLGRATYGMQFHFEMHRPVVADLARHFAAMVEEVHPGFAAALPDGPGGHGPAADAAGLAIARAWVGLI